MTSPRLAHAGLLRPGRHFNLLLPGRRSPGVRNRLGYALEAQPPAQPPFSTALMESALYMWMDVSPFGMKIERTNSIAVPSRASWFRSEAGHAGAPLCYGCVHSGEVLLGCELAHASQRTCDWPPPK